MFFHFFLFFFNIETTRPELLLMKDKLELFSLILTSSQLPTLTFHLPFSFYMSQRSEILL